MGPITRTYTAHRMEVHERAVSLPQAFGPDVVTWQPSIVHGEALVDSVTIHLVTATALAGSVTAAESLP
jgi:hypothetical protein